MSYSEVRKKLIYDLVRIGIDMDTSYGILQRMDTDEKAVKLSDWISANIDTLTESQMLNKVLEINDEQEDEFVCKEVEAAMTNRLKPCGGIIEKFEHSEEALRVNLSVDETYLEFCDGRTKEIKTSSETIQIDSATEEE